MKDALQPFSLLAGWVIVLATLLPIQTVPARADDPTPSSEPGYVLPETEVWKLTADSEDPYQIFVSRPKGPPPDGGYPVLYVLDGNAIFASFAEARRIQAGKIDNPFARQDIGNSLIVAVGYFTDWPYDARRGYDLTPPLLENVPPEQEYFSEVRQGGQDRFLDFLLNRLRPEVARRYSINPHRQSLFGHSFGGLFALHVLYTRPNAFDAIIAASPSQFWNNQAILAEEREFARRLANSEIQKPLSRVLLLAGEHEEVIEERWDTEALARRLEPLSAYGLRSRIRILESESHITVPSRAVTMTLRFAFNKP